MRITMSKPGLTLIIAAILTIMFAAYACAAAPKHSAPVGTFALA